ncbi:hypothetical protein ACP4OV_008525 [Aristida adscensionis]
MDAAACSSSPALHVVICPWLALGHLLPSLDLAERLASRGHRVTFVSTPRNIARLPPVRPAAAPRVGFVALPLPRVDGLPDGAESTNDVPHEKADLLWEAFDGLAAPFAEFLAAACADEGDRPDWVVFDIFHHWAAAAAVEHKVPSAMLILSAANNVAAWARRCLDQRAKQPSGAAADGQAAAVQERLAAPSSFESQQAFRSSTNHGASGMSIAQRCSLTLERCTLGAMRSCLEWEPESFPLAATLGGKPVVPFGLLPPSSDGGRGVDGDDAAVRWLDAQPPESVVYVALGSEAPLRAEQVHQLALGLELAGTRFLWALRKPTGVADADVLPPGFDERTRGRGLVTMRWVPQVSILAHGAVGAFLTHCGWNSIIEGLLFGRPLIMLPIYGDQVPNARLMERKKVGLQVPREESNKSFSREGVASAVRTVMVEGDTRRAFVANTKKLQEVVGDRECHERYIDGLIRQFRC